MMRLVPKEESEFKERFKRHVWQFIQDEGLNWRISISSNTVQTVMWEIASELWYIRQMVKPEDTDMMNTKAEREKLEKKMKQMPSKAWRSRHL